MRWLLILALCLPAFAANDVYIAATSAGGNTGVDCANAKALSYFNSAGNWSGSPTGIQIGPDTTAHLCGTFTATAGQHSLIQFQGSGTSGHPITLKWESGAIVQAPYCGAAPGCIDTNANTNLTIDGGANGILQNTANGTGLANQQASEMISASVCTNCTFTNLTIANVYVHTSLTDALGSGAYGINVQGGSGVTFGPNLTIHDADLGILYAVTGSYSNLVIHDNFIYDSNQDVEVGNIGATTLTGFLFYNNVGHDWSKWDDNTNSYHHNFLHTFAVGAAAKITGTYQVYNNYAYGDLGNHATSMMFFENNGGGVSDAPKVFNNVFNHTSSTNAGGNGLMRSEAAGGLLANNTFLDAGGTSGNSWNCLDLAANTWTVKNNIFQGCATYIYLEPAKTLTAMDFNDFYLGGPQWVYQSSFLSTIGTWRTACSCDASSVTTNPNLNGSYQPVATSGAIGAGADLSGLSITALNSDKNGNARSAPWAIGALNSGSAGTVVQRRR